MKKSIPTVDNYLETYHVSLSLLTIWESESFFVSPQCLEEPAPA